MNTGRSAADIAWRLRATLKALGMTQAEFARRCGFDPPKVNNWIQGTAIPSLPNAHIICDHLPVTLDWIYRGDASKLPGDLQAKLAAINPAGRRGRRAA
jgi:transcriptional regulator with XRE-family HTH domain